MGSEQLYINPMHLKSSLCAPGSYHEDSVPVPGLTTIEFLLKYGRGGGGGVVAGKVVGKR